MALPPLTPTSRRRAIVASSLGTVFEWYDFFLYGALAVLLGKLFFPSGNETAAFLSSLARPNSAASRWAPAFCMTFCLCS
ncbi:MAG: hypothetical protein VKK63_11170 [Synechococcus sp.]|nr:hypothetical protein [Synechococcus sp.]